MRAVNALEGFDSSKHSGVISHFNQFHVKTGEFPPETSIIIRKASALREKSDYEDFFRATESEALNIYASVKQFSGVVEAFLSEQV